MGTSPLWDTHGLSLSTWWGPAHLPKPTPPTSHPLSSLCSSHLAFLLFLQQTKLISASGTLYQLPGQLLPKYSQGPPSLAQVSAPKITSRENTSLLTSPSTAGSGSWCPHLRVSCTLILGIRLIVQIKEKKKVPLTPPPTLPTWNLSKKTFYLNTVENIF